MKYISGLQNGGRVIAIKSRLAKGDIGESGQTYSYESIVEGQIYEVSKVSSFGYDIVAWVVDSDATSLIVTTEFFKKI